MPIYEYRCQGCGERFEMLRGIKDSDESIKCPKCGTAKPKRTISAVFSRMGEGGSGGEIRMPT